MKPKMNMHKQVKSVEFRLPHTFLRFFTVRLTVHVSKVYSTERYSSIFVCRGDVTIARGIGSSSTFPLLNNSPADITLMMILATYCRQARWSTLSVLCLHMQACVQHQPMVEHPFRSAAMCHKADRMFVIDFRISCRCC
jgi:hypothetical protein